ncbi:MULTISPECIES: hypothetical protein [Thermofilum]|uniref:Uncharacterized protein n=2 Tax=Thermofilum TaxID=2268 RepID=S5ZA12_9CREN|nr:hypothetical protein [Thermofilum adornatum]AGT36205.1 hypothetical protein N186_09345 [Thermofilum adornatum]
MLYINVSERVLQKISTWKKVWLPYVLYTSLHNPKYVYLFDCVFSSKLRNDSLSLLLSRRIEKEYLASSENIPFKFPLYPDKDCQRDVLEYLTNMYREQSLQMHQNVSFEQTDYLAVRMLGVPSAMRKLEEYFRQFSKRSPLQGILNDIQNMELEHKGIAYSLFVFDGKMTYNVIGEKLIQMKILEKYLTGGQVLEQLFP